jgi:two-component system, cell cycle response regulator
MRCTVNLLIKVLVVEDSPTQAKWLASLLTQEGYETRVVENGVQALAKLGEWTPDLVITDIMMPEMDGYELCLRIKEQEQLRGTPVILLTSLSDPSDVLKALKCGADNFITKPYEPDFLLSRVNQTIMNQRLLKEALRSGNKEVVYFNGTRHDVPTRLTGVVPLLLSTYEEAVFKNRTLTETLQSIKALEADYRAILESSADGIIVCTEAGVVQYVNPAAALLLCRDKDDIYKHPIEFELEPGVTKEVDIVTDCAQHLVAEINVVEAHWERKPGLLISLRDVTEKVKQRNSLQTMAYDDEMTGLHNRRGFLTLATKQMSLARERNDSLIIVFIDLDGLKWINDNLGHHDGDLALTDMAEVLNTAFRQSDIIARLGGDEFVVMTVDAPIGCVDVLADRLQRTIEAHNRIAGRQFTLAASAGTVIWNPQTNEDIEMLLTRADAVMYEVKKARKGSRGDKPVSKS